LVTENIYTFFYNCSFLTLDALFLFLIIFSYNKIVHYFGTNILLKFIFFFIAVKLILYYFLPSILRIFSFYQFEVEDHVKLSDLLRVYIIELGSWFFWMIGFLLILFIRNKKKVTKQDNIIFKNINESKNLLLIFSLGFIIQVYNVISFSSPNIIFSIFGQLFFYTGLASGPTLIFLTKKLKYNKIYFISGLVCFLFSLLSLSTRGAFVYSILFLAFLIHFILKNKKTTIYFYTFLIISSILLLLSGSVTSRISIDENGLVISPKDFIEKNEGRTMLQEVEWRFGASTRVGTAFLTMYEEGLNAGINPIKNSLSGFLPRTIDENKPHPSTLRGDDVFSQGMYLIMARVEGNPTSMVEFPTGCHFYWEFGYLGVAILSMISGIYVGICYSFWKNLGLISIPLILAIFKPWGYVDPKIWVSDIALQLYQIIIPFIVIVLIYRFVIKIAFLFKQSLFFEKTSI
jgi:hypothetical protein